MELIIMPKGSKYLVEDKKSRLLYTVKKKGFGNSRWVLLDASNYNLYTLLVRGDERKPAFTIILNDATFMQLECKSMFLDPTITAKGKELEFSVASKDRKEFEIIQDEKVIGHIKTRITVSGDLQYDLDIENTSFDDYIPLFAVAIDRAFGDMNKQS